MNLFCQCRYCRRLRLACLSASMSISVCLHGSLGPYISCSGADTHMKPRRWKASELLCHSLQQLKARGALTLERLGPQVPCSAWLHRKAPGCTQTWRPDLFWTFHLMSEVENVPWAVLTRRHENFTLKLRAHCTMEVSEENGPSTV